MPTHAASREFQVMVKPVGPVCNLDCRYCYYLRKKNLYPRGELFRMPDELLERYIIQHIQASPREVILFSWHGGEPTILGVDYFRRIVELQHKHRPPGCEILNGIQTNGTLLDENWCRFLAAERFYVGLSLDGPRELHNRYRIAKAGQGTHKQVMQAYRLLRQHRVSTDVLCVIHQGNVRQPFDIYRFFKELDIEFLQFLPLVARQNNGGVSAETVPADAYGTFLCTVFREWVRHDIGRIGIQNFDEALRPFLGMDHALCVFRETCGDVVALEHNGDLYSCDHFVDHEHRLGNIHDQPLVELLDCAAQRQFGNQKRASMPRSCRSCDVLDLCNGGCPKDRFISTPEGEGALNYLCAAYKRFFTYSRPYLQRVASCRQSGQPVEPLMQSFRTEDSAPGPEAGRNAPCPCGSGKKYKKCCMGKIHH